ncbi:protein Abitram-like isoform X1 [Ischnura elegans]|uniref:protein Abitram-like isoform X1 n=1 Tax=Ischnura elegans TaxID=197161 RepID=UPI001ED8B36A|nr:protein Abitram-like isoform X1 [Ischnura elegans]
MEAGVLGTRQTEYIAPPIEKSGEKHEEYSTVTERYYTPRFAVNVVEKEDDFCVLFHSNKICVITLAPSHPILRLKKEVVDISFQVSTKVDRSQNKVSGKGKKGAQILHPNSALCIVKCSDNSKYTLYSCVQGKLVEVNENLMEKPSLLVSKPSSSGYIAIILPNLLKSKQQKDELLTPEKYEEYLLTHNSACESKE